MGVGTVNAPPKEVLSLFDRPEFIFSRLFPRIDKMFIKARAPQPPRTLPNPPHSRGSETLPSSDAAPFPRPGAQGVATLTKQKNLTLCYAQ